MILIYTTLENNEQARKIAHILLQNKLTNCVNFFPINCIYNYKNKIEEESETVLIIKTKEDKFNQVEKVIKENISFENFIGQIEVKKINDEFENWLNSSVA